MPQTVPTSAGFSPSFDYSAFQFDLSLLSDDYGTSNLSMNNTNIPTIITTTISNNHQLQVSATFKPAQIKQEAHSPRPGSPSGCTYLSPNYPCLGGELSPNYSRDASPAYPTSPYYVPQSPQSAQLYPTSPEPSVTTSTTTSTASSKQPVKREKSFDLLTILHESR